MEARACLASKPELPPLGYTAFPFRNHGYPHSLQMKELKFHTKLSTQKSHNCKWRGPAVGATYYMSCVNLEAGSTFSHALGKNMVRSQIAHFRLKKKKKLCVLFFVGDTVSICKNGSVGVFSLPQHPPPIFPDCEYYISHS